MKRGALVAGAAAAYIVAAWMVSPGFYDGIAPPQPYNFVCPPPVVGANLPPTAGHLVVKIINGESDPTSAFTDDGQVLIGFLPGAFDVTGKTSVTVDITPVSPCPNPAGIHFSTNVYLVTADAPLIKPSTLVLRYSNLVVDPSFVYRADSPNGPWTNIGASPQSRLWTLDVSTNRLGYFAAGYPSNAISNKPGSGSQVLPITVAVLIFVVLVGGFPLAMLRRRQARGGAKAADEEEEDGEG